MSFLLNQPGVDKVRLDQCMFGAISVKSTDFLAVYVPLQSLVHDTRNHGRCDGFHEHEDVMGLDDDGHFLTAQLKVYAPPLCSLLAEALHMGIQRKVPSTGHSLSD